MACWPQARSSPPYLTAVIMTRHTQTERAFAVLMAVVAAGLMRALGFNDRCRAFSTLSAIVAKPRHLGAFRWAERTLVILGGGVLGLMTGKTTA
ncbi:MAG: hypothetical protein KGH84_03535 [Paracoccaceae bacterium]|nr:hypothetical protein [Paracoccaceae bacterium]